MARVFYVDANGPDGNGGRWDTAIADLQDALALARDGDEILVAQGTYYPTADTDRTKSFLIEYSISIRGGYPTGGGTQNPGTNVTILSGDIDGGGLDDGNSYHVVKAVSVSGASVEGFTISGGYANPIGDAGKGGGIYCANATITIADCNILGNYARNGGGVYSFQSSLTIEDCHGIEGNTTSNYGGGVYCSGGDVTISNCTITDNDADGYGGGLYSFQSSLMIENCDGIDGNSSGSYGGGVYCSGGDVTISNCTITDNDADQDGGGLFSDDDSNPTVVDCLIANNTSARFGAGIFCYDAAIIGCTISGNEVGGSGGGAMCSGEALFANCRIEENEAETWGGGIYFYRGESGISSSVVSNCLITDNWTVDRSSGNGEGAAVEACTNVKVTLINCTIVGNHGNSSGKAAIDCDQTPATVALLNSVVWGNEASGSAGGIDHLSPQPRDGEGDTVTATYCDIEQSSGEFGDPSDHNINVDPELDSAFRLTDDSDACIDAGDPNFVPDAYGRRDIDGQFRIWDGDPDHDWYVDMGADEYNSYCYGDLDGDDDIDEYDEAIQWFYYQNMNGTKPRDGDMDMDGDVEIDDVDILVDLIGTACN